MNAEKQNPKTKSEELSLAYEISKTKFQGIDRATFDFDA